MSPRVIAFAGALLILLVGCKTTETPKKDGERDDNDARYPRDERPYEPPVTSGSQDCNSATDRSTCASRSCEWDNNSSSCRDSSTITPPLGGATCSQYQNPQQCLQFASSGCSWDYNSNRCSTGGNQGGFGNCQQYVGQQQCLQYMSQGCNWDYNSSRCYDSGGASGNSCQTLRDQYSCQQQAQQGCQWDLYQRVCKSAVNTNFCQNYRDPLQCGQLPGCQWDAYQRVCRPGVNTNFCQNYRDPYQCRQIPGCQWMQNGIQGYCFGGTTPGGYANCQQYNTPQLCQQYFQQCRWEISLFSARCANR